MIIINIQCYLCETPIYHKICLKLLNWSKKNVLVTGCLGFIGQNLVKKLFSLNAEIIGVDIHEYSNNQVLDFFDDKILDIDTRSDELNSLKNEDFDYVFHFGAPSSVILFNKDRANAMNNTILGFLNIVKFVVENNISKLIYPSSGSVYGISPPPQSEKNFVKPTNLYGVAKYACEEIARLEPNLSSTGLRIFAGYGPGEEHKKEIASPVTLFLNSILKNESPVVFGNGNQERDFVYIDDVINSILRCAEVDTPPVINVGSGESYSFNYVINKINELTEKNVNPKYIEKPINYLERTKADITIMKDALGIIPTSLDSGLKKYLIKKGII